MENITRDIIADLYPLYLSGDASPDTRRIVESFLHEDPEFARSLTETETGSLVAHGLPSLSPDHELKTLDRLKHRLWGPIGLLQLALVTSCFAFGRIVSDTSFDVSPRKFIVTAAIAVCFWVAFFIQLLRGRRAVLSRPR